MGPDRADDRPILARKGQMFGSTLVWVGLVVVLAGLAAGGWRLTRPRRVPETDAPRGVPVAPSDGVPTLASTPAVQPAKTERRTLRERHRSPSGDLRILFSADMVSLDDPDPAEGTEAPLRDDA